MRTNIELDDALVQEAMRYSQARTKRALVDEALRTLVLVRTEAQARKTYGDEVRALDARLQGLRLGRTPQDILREDRERA